MANYKTVEIADETMVEEGSSLLCTREPDFAGEFTQGRIYTVASCDYGDRRPFRLRDSDDHSHWIENDGSFELVVPVKEIDAPEIDISTKEGRDMVKVGDLLMCVNATGISCGNFVTGSAYLVTEIDEDDPIAPFRLIDENNDIYWVNHKGSFVYYTGDDDKTPSDEETNDASTSSTNTLSISFTNRTVQSNAQFHLSSEDEKEFMNDLNKLMVEYAHRK